MNYKFLQSKYSKYYILFSVVAIFYIVTSFYILFTEPINNIGQELRIIRGSSLTQISVQLEKMKIISNKHFSWDLNRYFPNHIHF